MATDLQGELTAMVQEMQNLEKAMEELGTLLTESTAKIEQVDHQATALVQSATNAVGHHQEDLAALGNEIHTTSGQFKTEIEQTGEQVQTQAQQLTSAAEKAFSTVDTATQNVGHLDETSGQQSQHVTQQSEQFEQLIKQIESSLSSRVEAATQTVTQGVQHLGSVAQHWEQKGEETAQSVTDALHKTSDEIDQKFVAPLDDAVKQFTDLTKQIEDEVLNNPISALTDKLKNEILTEAKSEIDAIAAQLEKVIEDAISGLTDSGDSNDAINKEVRQLFDELQPLWDKLTDALRSVQSIWDTVKNAVEAL